MNGEPAKTEHAGSFGLNVPGQIVLITPGPIPDRKKFRVFTPTGKDIKGLVGGVTGRFAMVPVTAGANNPKLVVTDVPAPVWMQFPAKTTVVFVTVTPSPPQFARLRIPTGFAKA